MAASRSAARSALSGAVDAISARQMMSNRNQRMLNVGRNMTTTSLRYSYASPRPSYHQRIRGFHASSRRMEGPTKSPFQAFVDTLREELKKSQEMQENMKQLQGEAGKVQDSETMKRVREAYERARIVASIKENPRLQKAAEQLRKSGGQVGDAVGATLKQMEESELIKGLGAISSRLARQLEDTTAPIRNTEAYRAFAQTLTDAFDDGGSALRIITDSEADARTQRKIKREIRLRKIGKPAPSEDVEDVMLEATKVKDKMREMEDSMDPQAAAQKAKEAEKEGAEGEQAEEAQSAPGPTEAPAGETSPEASGSKQPPPKPKGFAARVRSQAAANPNAGQALVLRPEPKYKQAWSSFKESNPVMRRLSELRESYDESENPFVERLRGITETIGGWFEENETAKVVRAFQTLDHTFTLDGFQKELREYIVPEIIDSYHGAARHLLRQWCGEATFNVLMATIDPYVQRGAVLNGRLLDLKQVEILQARMLENDVPVVVVSFSSQELMYFKDAKTGEILAGREDQADLCRYAMVLTRLEEEMDNEITGGWKVVELARRGQAAFL
ncbi:Tim44-domain-containing protein [Meira miltonrushii]|uniref:Mitochondrial import inner membrane translocase subunit TIM44 n=1 Tax=Meira miltonrushii TaxID=1280837 RepID=A0A316V7H6_9BASI|nr:Tim44-domain-containing protein [Meira miltonrushii]PWN32163.1 Tim44-domain-containing protein [Meira miltonrushii]